MYLLEQTPILLTSSKHTLRHLPSRGFLTQYEDGWTRWFASYYEAIGGKRLLRNSHQPHLAFFEKRDGNTT